MTLPLTKDMLRAAYNYLNETEPFCRWNLPDGDDITFRVVRDRINQGFHIYDNGKHTIAVSKNQTGHTITLMGVMAHEMIHVHEQHSRACTKGEHSAAFRKWALEVCAFHGFDPKFF
jgi:hypothetical protein